VAATVAAAATAGVAAAGEVAGAVGPRPPVTNPQIGPVPSVATATSAATPPAASARPLALPTTPLLPGRATGSALAAAHPTSPAAPHAISATKPHPRPSSLRAHSSPTAPSASLRPGRRVTGTALAAAPTTSPAALHASSVRSQRLRRYSQQGPSGRWRHSPGTGRALSAGRSISKGGGAAGAVTHPGLGVGAAGVWSLRGKDGIAFSQPQYACCGSKSAYIHFGFYRGCRSRRLYKLKSNFHGGPCSVAPAAAVMVAGVQHPLPRLGMFRPGFSALQLHQMTHRGTTTPSMLVAPLTLHFAAVTWLQG
jgi:hypothetical protein